MGVLNALWDRPVGFVGDIESSEYNFRYSHSDSALAA